MTAKTAIVLSACATTLLLSVSLALWLGRRAKSGDWSTGGRRLPVYVVIGTQFATMMGGGVLVGQVGVGYANGWATVTYGAFTAIGVIPLLLLIRWLRAGNLTSLPDVLTRLYGKNRTMDIIAIALSIIIPFGWLCSNLVAFGRLLAPVLNLDSMLLIPAFGLICLAFVIPGGLTSVAWTDFIFGVGMVILCAVTATYTINFAGGWGNIALNTPPEISQFPEGLWSVGASTIIFWLLAVMPGNLTNQQLYQRVFAAKSDRGAAIGIVSSAALYALTLVWAATLGLSIRAVAPTLNEPEEATGWLLSQLPTGILAVFAALIVGTLMSTASSAIQSCVVNITKDIYVDNFNSGASEDTILKLSRITSVAVLTLAVAFAMFYSQALQWIVMTFAYSVSALLAPIFGGYALRNKGFLTSRGAVGGMICGILGAGVAHALGTQIPYVAFGVTSSLIGLVVISKLTSRRAEEPVAH